MTNTINNAAINPATNKEEMDMKKRAIIIVDGDERIETTLDAMSLEELLDMKELTKDIIRAYLEEEGIKYSNTLFNKTKRVELIHELFDVMHPVIKEDTTMKNTDLATRTLNMNKVERLVYVRDNILNITKTTDELYIKKEELVKFLFDNDIISRYPSKNELSKTKRQEFVDILMTVVQNLIDNKVITPVNNEPATHQVIGIDRAYYDEEYVEFEGTLEQCQNYVANIPYDEFDLVRYRIDDIKPTPNNDAKAKTDKLFALIKACAADNQKKGYGYTISSFMLQACILEAGAGVKKFKGHKITEEESKMTHNVYKWLKDKGFIKPVVYSVVEDPNVRIYLDSYTGRTDSPKTKLIPFSKSNGYTAKQVTSFTVTL